MERGRGYSFKIADSKSGVAADPLNDKVHTEAREFHVPLDPTSDVLQLHVHTTDKYSTDFYGQPRLGQVVQVVIDRLKHPLKWLWSLCYR